MALFDKKLALFHWLLNQFGAEEFSVLKNILSDDNLLGFDEENSTLFFHELADYVKDKGAVIEKETLSTYDANIVRHWKHITQKRNECGHTLYPLYFQYLAMLFTEHYLDRYFADRDALCHDLNESLDSSFNSRLPANEAVEPFKPKDLNKLAVWIATGGGKTLIMHVNVLQFQHYLKKADREKEINNTILLTPNEGLTLQHLKELKHSDIEADLFEKGGATLFDGLKKGITIIDIYKLQEKEGEKTVAIDSFEKLKRICMNRYI